MNDANGAAIGAALRDISQTLKGILSQLNTIATLLQRRDQEKPK